MTIDQKREQISSVYDSDRWRRRVMIMEDRQVAAIYGSFRRRGVLNKRKKKRKGRAEASCIQLTIFDLMKEENT